ncbi:MAG: hypothetical protein IIA45_08970 [Bacteroidetes bacterium]|nr:hypothetical protein [Bacteroidota bacterium]
MKIQLGSSIHLLMLVLLFLPACKKNNLKDCVEHVTSDCLIVVDKTNIRINNISEYDFCNFVLIPMHKSANYGNIKSGKTSCYIPFDQAYGYSFVQLFIGKDEFIIQPIDYVGEPLLDYGTFTYSIDLIDYDTRSLSIIATKD